MTDKNGPDKLTKRRKAYIRAKLLEERRQLIETLGRKASEYSQRAPAPPGDEGDWAVEAMDTEMDFGFATSASASLADVEHALKKLDEGSYGACERCGARIPDARLRVVPFARLCLPCKEREERESLGGERNPGRSWGRVMDLSDKADALERAADVLKRDDRLIV